MLHQQYGTSTRQLTDFLRGKSDNCQFANLDQFGDKMYASALFCTQIQHKKNSSHPKLCTQIGKRGDPTYFLQVLLFCPDFHQQTLHGGALVRHISALLRTGFAWFSSVSEDFSV